MKKKVKAVSGTAENPESPPVKSEKKKWRISRRERAERRLTSVFLMPSFLGVMLFFILPFLVVIYYSLIDNPTTANFTGLENFTKLFSNNAFKLALKNTGIFSITAVPLVVIIALALAVLLESNIPYKSTFRTIFLSPMIVPAASIILIWQVLFD